MGSGPESVPATAASDLSMATERGEAGAPLGGDAGLLAQNAAPSDEEANGSEDKDEIDDGAETPPTLGQGQVYKHPLDGWTKAQIDDQLTTNPETLGSMSIGYTNAGALYNGVKMTESSAWELVDPDHAWGTKETIDYLAHCLGKVTEQFPGSPTMYIGHISGRRGGHLSPRTSSRQSAPARAIWCAAIPAR